jgi:hypothetical protein
MSVMQVASIIFHYSNTRINEACKCIFRFIAALSCTQVRQIASVCRRFGFRWLQTASSIVFKNLHQRYTLTVRWPDTQSVELIFDRVASSVAPFDL